MSEEIIQSDYEAWDELLRVGGSRNTFIEANCKVSRNTWKASLCGVVPLLAI